MRVAARVLAAQADQLEGVLDALVAGVAVRHALRQQALADDVRDRHPRVERPERVLEDDLHPAAQRPHVLGIDVGELVAVEHDPAVRGRGQLDDRPPERRLAAARLADQRERLAGHDLEVHAVHGVHGADLAAHDPAVDREVLLEALDREQRRDGRRDRGRRGAATRRRVRPRCGAPRTGGRRSRPADGDLHVRGRCGLGDHRERVRDRAGAGLLRQQPALVLAVEPPARRAAKCHTDATASTNGESRSQLGEEGGVRRRAGDHPWWRSGSRGPTARSPPHATTSASDQSWRVFVSRLTPTQITAERDRDGGDQRHGAQRRP